MPLYAHILYDMWSVDRSSGLLGGRIIYDSTQAAASRTNEVILGNDSRKYNTENGSFLNREIDKRVWR